MTPEQTALVQESFARVVRRGDQLAADFYRRLFELDPALRPMFGEDIEVQARKMVRVLAVVITRLDRLPTLIDTVRALGARHAGYGAKPEHYETVGQALIDTLGNYLGATFDHETRDAWTAAYTTLSAEMIGAMRERRTRAA